METKKMIVVKLAIRVPEPPIRGVNESTEDYWERIETWSDIVDMNIRQRTYKLLEITVPDEEPSTFLEMSEVYRFINKPNALKLYEEYKADQRDGFVSNTEEWIETKMKEKESGFVIESDLRIMKEDIKELIQRDNSSKKSA